MGLGIVEYSGLKFNYRLDTTDWGIIQEACGGLNTRYFDVERGELWFDIGAHIGAFTCYAAKKQAFVKAFEPVLSNFDLLSANVRDNELESWTRLNNCALTKDGKDIQLFIDEQNFGNCSKYYRGPTSYQIVSSKPASILNNYADYCIKIDTEGCEYEILSSIDLGQVRKLIMEDHYWLISKEEDLALKNLILDNFPNVQRYQEYMIYAWR